MRRDSEYGVTNSGFEKKMLCELNFETQTHACVFYKDGCVKCKMTVNKLHMPCKTIRATQEDVDRLISYGVHAMPYVEVYEHSKVADVWSDFRADKIKKWNDMAK